MSVEADTMRRVAMDSRNLTRADCRYIDELCADNGAIDMGSGLDYALERFGDQHDLALSPDEIYHPTQAESEEIARIASDYIRRD